MRSEKLGNHTMKWTRQALHSWHAVVPVVPGFHGLFRVIPSSEYFFFGFMGCTPLPIASQSIEIHRDSWDSHRRWALCPEPSENSLWHPKLMKRTKRTPPALLYLDYFTMRSGKVVQKWKMRCRKKAHGTEIDLTKTPLVWSDFRFKMVWVRWRDCTLARQSALAQLRAAKK